VDNDQNCLSCVYNRLPPEDSYINGHRFIPHCAYAGQLATVCRCEDGHSLFNCTTDDTQQKVKIFRTTGTNSCGASGGFSRRWKRNAAEQEPTDDDVIMPDDFPIPSPPDTTDFPPPRTWPTASGITEQQARDACQRLLEGYAAYDICRQHVDLEPVIGACVLNIKASLYVVFSSLSPLFT